jgi:hypothetical protein
VFICTFSFSVPHKQNSQRFKSGEHRDYNPLLMNHLAKTSPNQSLDKFPAVTLSCIKCLYDFYIYIYHFIQEK